jgi:hypothetical protein
VNVTKRRASGRVSVNDAFTKCAAGLPVRLQRRTKRGGWATVGSDLTSASGAYSVPGKRAKGRYRAVANASTLSSGDLCGAATSPTDRL